LHNIFLTREREREREKEGGEEERGGRERGEREKALLILQFKLIAVQLCDYSA